MVYVIAFRVTEARQIRHAIGALGIRRPPEILKKYIFIYKMRILNIKILYIKNYKINILYIKLPWGELPKMGRVPR